MKKIKLYAVVIVSLGNFFVLLSGLFFLIEERKILMARISVLEQQTMVSREPLNNEANKQPPGGLSEKTPKNTNAKFVSVGPAYVTPFTGQLSQTDVRATGVENQDNIKPAVQKNMVVPNNEVSWDENNRTILRIAEFTQLVITLPPDDEIEIAKDDVVIGDFGVSFRAFFKKKRPRQIQVTPLTIGSTTSLVIFGKKRDYHFILHSIPSGEYEEGQTVAQIVLPQGDSTQQPLVETLNPESINRSGTEETSQNSDDFLSSTTLNPSNLKGKDYSVRISSREALNFKPDSIFHDGVNTYLLYHKDRHSSIPSDIFKVVQGVNRPVNSIVKGEDSSVIVVQAVGDIMLKYGQEFICLKYKRGRV